MRRAYPPTAVGDALGEGQPDSREPQPELPPGLTTRVIAFHLPQFHPVPENDEWWGTGFTEWTNTARARPLFRGHQQPNIPADLGFYDLRVPETRLEQALLAAEYGVEAFCYWHYWFAGRRLLERPFQEILDTGEPRYSFCLAWANQTWTGIWHGAPNRILVEQTYPGEEDERQHFSYLLQAFKDPRYFRVEGKPLFYIFRPEQLPDPHGLTERWRTMAARAGLPGLYLVAEMSDLLGAGTVFRNPVEAGFDAGVYIRLPADNAQTTARLQMRFRRKVLRHPEIYEYARRPLAKPPEARRPEVLPCVYPNWDNTPRSGRNGLALVNSEPERFRVHVRDAIQSLQDRPAEQRLLFIKSWNEWAEGNYLEPDQRRGRASLEVLREELLRSGRRTG